VSQIQHISIPDVPREDVAAAFVAAGVAALVNSSAPPDGTLYMLRSSTGVVKIGHTHYEIRERLFHVAGANKKIAPLFAVACCPAARDEETSFHRAHRRWACSNNPRSRIEWYRADSPVADAVNLLDHQLDGRGSVICVRPEPLISFRGHRLALEKWGRIAGVTDQAIRERLRRGWTLEAALTTPTTQGKAA